MSRSIEVIIAPDGGIKIDAVGFKGVDCEQATRFLEQALGLQAEAAQARVPPIHPSAEPTDARIMNMPVITFDPAGNGDCLFTEAIDLSALGALEIVRASTIEFNNVAQLWEVKSTDGLLLFSHPSRQACLDWEHQHFNQ